MKGLFLRRPLWWYGSSLLLATITNLGLVLLMTHSGWPWPAWCLIVVAVNLATYFSLDRVYDRLLAPRWPA